MKIKTLRIIFIVSALALIGIKSADAAVMKLVADKETAAIGDTINVNLKIDSEGTGINAAEAVIQFPINILEVKSISKEGSVFNFWLEEPTFSNEDGKISFVGGSTSGRSGATLQVLTITFGVKGGGKGEIVFLDGAVTASDGSGTNVLTSMRGFTVDISVSSSVAPGVAPAPPGFTAPTPPPPAPIPPPVQITRPAILTGKLPTKPELQVPLYQNPEGWYNQIAVFSALWSLPNDVTQIATLLNQIPGANPTKSEGLFENKSFSPLKDGISYLHVRFKNDIGWGPTAHYRIAIDTTPPLPFEVSIDSGASSDNPTPTLMYKSGDDLSGLMHYVIKVVGGETEIATEESFKLKPLAPGSHTVTVSALDNAGNATETNVDIEVIPIASPVITFVSERVILDENNISIAGTAVPNGQARLTLILLRGDVVGEKNVAVDPLGNWSGEFSESAIRRGEYKITAQAIDERGAMSLPVESSIITVKDKPLLTLFGVDISRFWFLTMLIILLLSAFAGGFLFEQNLSRKRAREILIARRDISNAFNRVVKEVDTILSKYQDGRLDDREAIEIKSILERLKENAEKAGKYIGESVEEIK